MAYINSYEKIKDVNPELQLTTLNNNLMCLYKSIHDYQNKLVVDNLYKIDIDNIKKEVEYHKNKMEFKTTDSSIEKDYTIDDLIKKMSLEIEENLNLVTKLYNNIKI